MIIEVLAADALEFVEVYSTNIRSGTASEALTFVESFTSSIKPEVLFDSINYVDTVTDTAKVLTRTLVDTLVFSETLIPKSYWMIIDDFLFMYDELLRPIHGNLTDSISFEEFFTPVWSRQVDTDVLTFEDSFICTIIGTRLFNESLSLIDAFNYYIAKVQPYTASALEPISVVTLVDSFGNTLELPNPKFGDTETVQYKRKNTATRGGHPIIEGYPEWLPKKLFKVEFDTIKESLLNDIRIFIKRNVGRPITITDHNQVIRSVIVQNPDREYSQIGRFDYALTLDMYEL